MKKSILCGILVCLSVVAFAQQKMDWYAYWGSNETGSQIDPQRMVADKDGNIYVAALYGGDKVKVGDQTLASNSATDKGDAVIIKVSPSGSVLWTYSVAAAGSATVSDIAIDAYGNIFVTGAFSNAINVGTKQMPVDDTNMGEAALYVLKLRADGSAVRAWQISALGAKAGGIAIDSENNVIIAGLLDGDATLTWGGEVAGDFQNSAQLIVAKYTNKGTLVWSDFRCKGTATYSKPSVAVDANDNIYVGTAVNGKTTFNEQQISSSVSNAVLFAYSAAGVQRWYHMIDGEEADDAAAVAVSPIGQVVLAVNHHSGDLRIDDMDDVFNNGYAFDAAFTHSAFFAFDLNGEFKWFYDWGYSNGTSGSDAVCYSLRCTDEGVWYSAGLMTGRHGGSRLPVERIDVKEGETSPPKRYNSGSLILAMENAGQLIEDEELRAQIRGSGIGTSATRAEILKKLVSTRALALAKKTQIVTPTLRGEMIFDTVDCSIRSLLNPELTASWEMGLTKVAEGALTSAEYMAKLEDFIRRRTQKVKESDYADYLSRVYERDAAWYRKPAASKNQD